MGEQITSEIQAAAEKLRDVSLDPAERASIIEQLRQKQEELQKSGSVLDSAMQLGSGTLLLDVVEHYLQRGAREAYISYQKRTPSLWEMFRDELNRRKLLSWEALPFKLDMRSPYFVFWHTVHGFNGPGGK